MPSSTEIVNALLEADPDDLSPDQMLAYAKQDYQPGYRQHTTNLNQEIWTDDRLLRRAFSWLTRIGAAPKFGTRPIHYYQQDQCAAIDAIRNAAKAKGVELGWVRYRRGEIHVYSHGRWVPIARVDRGEIVPV